MQQLEDWLIALFLCVSCCALSLFCDVVEAAFDTVQPTAIGAVYDETLAI